MFVCGQVLKYEYLRNPSLVGFGKSYFLISSYRKNRQVLCYSLI